MPTLLVGVGIPDFIKNMNLQKRVLLQLQHATFLGVVMDSHGAGTSVRLPTLVQSLQTCLNLFKTGLLVHVDLCL